MLGFQNRVGFEGKERTRIYDGEGSAFEMRGACKEMIVCRGRGYVMSDFFLQCMSFWGRGGLVGI